MLVSVLLDGQFCSLVVFDHTQLTNYYIARALTGLFGENFWAALYHLHHKLVDVRLHCRAFFLQLCKHTPYQSHTVSARETNWSGSAQRKQLISVCSTDKTKECSKDSVEKC